MGLSKNSSLALVCFAILAMVHSSLAQNSPQDYLNAHNTIRAQVGVGPMTWDPNVADFAQNYANQRAGDCAMIHSGGGGMYGENIAAGSGDFTGAMAVDLWAGEEPDYDYNSNSCAPGKVCGHYTQIVWRDSVRLGCARVQCNSGSWFVTCNYDPPGNFVGQSPY
ncbi:CAP (Cysteine-rich secretory proteins, Antigen 5, and Pathogenesis-related 1 protein) superfamily protein [Actinidia rufa]|uniref:CAP (Cysteine-rich secretory proteins, Antigen 5, and Pathogenesis-related 1 protein) superfamily protein n=1 Tax=Actinidia rufa TaxID=165716 RepID=A0A7J0ESN7_9ERIC|nr:CAP (Cysteine-rich secretory proteins, Antigen 5, and Pathogenesis-related 1 protein) superfamily protein [Actinidia rufa]